MKKSTFYILFASGKLYLNEKERQFFFDQVLKVTDWESVCRIAKEHNVAAILYKNLLTISDQLTIPPEIMEKLRGMYLKSVYKNTKYYAELKNIGSKLSEDTVEFILLKGIFLSKWLYNDIGLRPMGDIDILVSEKDIEKTKYIFFENGWALLNKEKMFKSIENFRVDAIVTHQPYSFIKEGIVVELHRSICNKLINHTIDISELLKKNQTYSIFNEQFRSLSITDTLLHLCIHAYGDSLGHGIKLKNTMDIAVLLKHHSDKIDWNELYISCIKYHCYKEVKCSLLIAHNYWGAPINNLFAIAGLKYVIYEKIFLNSLNKGVLYRLVRAFRAYKGRLKRIRIAKTTHDKLKMITAEVFPSRAYVHYQYHLKKKYGFHFKLYKLIYISEVN